MLVAILVSLGQCSSVQQARSLSDSSGSAATSDVTDK